MAVQETGRFPQELKDCDKNAKRFHKRGQMQAAIDGYTEAIRICGVTGQPAHYSLHLNLANCFRHEGRIHDRANFRAADHHYLMAQLACPKNDPNAKLEVMLNKELLYAIEFGSVEMEEAMVDAITLLPQVVESARKRRGQRPVIGSLSKLAIFSRNGALESTHGTGIELAPSDGSNEPSPELWLVSAAEEETTISLEQDTEPVDSAPRLKLVPEPPPLVQESGWASLVADDTPPFGWTVEPEEISAADASPQ